MRKILCFTALILCFSGLKAQFRDYKVKLWIHEFWDSTIYIKGAYGENSALLLDSLKMQKDGSFLLQGNFHSGIVVASSTHEDLFSFLLDKETVFTIDAYPDGFCEVKGSIENDRYLEYQRMNREYRSVLHNANTELKKSPNKKDSLHAEAAKAKKRFSDYQQSFYNLYPDNLMTILVRAVTPPDFGNTYTHSDGTVKEGKELEYAYAYRLAFWDNFDFSDRRIMGTPYFYKKYKTYINNLTMQDADSVFASLKYFVDIANQRGGQLYADYIIDHYLRTLPRLPFSFNEVLYTKIVDSLLNERYTPWLSAHEKEAHQANIEKIRPFLPYNHFPDITAQTLEGKTLNLYSLKNRYTVVYFWSAGCESCKRGIGELIDFYNTDKEKYDFEIFSIEMGGDSVETKKQLTETPFEWIVLQSNPTQIEKLYSLDIEHTPEIYILDSQKRILNKTAAYPHVKAVIEQQEKFH